jgi:AI-2 transport protein TqsA
MVTGGYILINVIFGSIIDPKILGRGLGLSTLVVFISLSLLGMADGAGGHVTVGSSDDCA